MFAQSLQSLTQCILCTTHALLTATPGACEIIRTLKFLGISWFRRPGPDLLSVLGAANVLVRRDAHDRARAAGETVRILHI